MLCTVLPVKAFDAAKSRLGPCLTPADRQALAQLLFRRTLDVVEAAALGPIVLVTRDAAAAALAEARGHAVLMESGSSHNEAVAQGQAWALRAGADELLTVASDLPLLSLHDLRALLRHRGADRLAIAPDRLGWGTNAIFVSPPGRLRFTFGPDSLRKHLASAAEHGLAVTVVRTPGLGVDLDVASDVDCVEGWSDPQLIPRAERGIWREASGPPCVTDSGVAIARERGR